MNKKVIITLNGELQNNRKQYQSILPNNGVYIAADGGALILQQLNITPDVIIGDMDSLSQENLKTFQNKGAKIITYPVEKNETDAELALDYCRKNNFYDVTIIGSLGGRYDQQLANTFLLEYAQRAGIKAVIREPSLEVGLINNTKEFINKSGCKLSLIPLDNPVKEVKIKGCKYNLTGINLCRYKTRGISNIIVKEKAVVSCQTGILLYSLTKNKLTS